jgi:hypothetical protein
MAARLEKILPLEIRVKNSPEGGAQKDKKDSLAWFFLI